MSCVGDKKMSSYHKVLKQLPLCLKYVRYMERVYVCPVGLAWTRFFSWDTLFQYFTLALGYT